MGMSHCGNTTTHVQSTEILCVVLGLGPCDGEGGFAPRDGSGEAARDARGAAVGVVDKRAGSPAWGLLEPAGVVTCRH